MNRKLMDNEEINHSIQTLARKNHEMEQQLKMLINELNEKKLCQDVKSSSQNDAHFESLKNENTVLNETIKQMQDEMIRLSQKPNVERLNFEPQPPNPELDVLRDEVATLRKELEEAKLSNAEGKNEPLRSRAARDDELAWSHLYGMKNVRQSRMGRTKPPTTTTTAPTIQLDKDSEEFIEFKVRELEQELEKAKEEILRQRLESNFRMQAIMPSITQNMEINHLQKKVEELEIRAIDQSAQRCHQSAEIAVGLKEKRQLELELASLKTRMQREYVPKIDAEVAKLQVDLLAKRFTGSSDFGLEEGLKEKFENLARERERAEMLRRRLGRQCISWETGMGPKRLKTSPLAFHSLPREKPPAVIEEIKPKLSQASTKNRCKFGKSIFFSRYSVELSSCFVEMPKKDLPSELAGLDSSSLKIELLKQKYLS